ncbi:uncharacterized protein MONBRDRAFT_11040 [Monosiga brevicollis MX1]|uniref:Major facilitator superfamily associated domain-containing protein n=1 Tax=Monosiga brevicollis TaxID=81824 RepID=A9V815_MONBE|nr:uncharacterized protein MONBRDRAFT_11040 [Monosiga brevicollis MX1]EDQ86191.1 predicted protein [Monosiga brevicollis MX1]|eukprot:XP_001748861.1 hypothetical protein [Monosiga brevicollis MX1]
MDPTNAVLELSQDQDLEVSLLDKDDSSQSDPDASAPDCETASLFSKIDARNPLLLIALIAFCINCQPSEPYLAAYLDDVKNLTEQLTSGPLIRTRMLLLFGHGLLPVVLSQITYAASSVLNTALFTILYTVLPTEHFARATGWTRGCYHCGNVVGALVAQALVSYAHWHGRRMDLLFVFSCIMTTLGCSVYLYGRWRCPALGQRPDKVVASAAFPIVRSHRSSGFGVLVRRLWRDYQDPHMAFWSVIFTFGYAATFVFGNYYQTLLTYHYTHVPYGLIEAVLELGSVAGTTLAATSRGTWAVHARPQAMAWLATLVAAGATFAAAFWHAKQGVFIALIVAQSLAARFLLAAAATQSAAHQRSEQFAAATTVNSFIGLALTSVVIACISTRPNAPTSNYLAAAATLTVAGTALASFVYRVVQWQRQRAAQRASIINEGTSAQSCSLAFDPSHCRSAA